MTLFDGLVALGVLMVVAWIVFISAAKKNPVMLPWIKEFFKDGFYSKIENKPNLKEKVEQVYDDKRSMM